MILFLRILAKLLSEPFTQTTRPYHANMGKTSASSEKAALSITMNQKGDAS
jgi:hypothetical protein